MDSLEARIHYHFLQPKLLIEAVTHPSVPYESKQPQRHNQRLEYLGDAVLQLILTEALYERFPEEDEGLLTKLRTRLVQARALARVARQIDLGRDLLIGKGEESNGGRQRDSTLADALEAVLGAIYLDGGLEAARTFVLAFWEEELAILMQEPVEQNPKGKLQEILQETSKQAPAYQIVASDGPDHARNFKAIVTWNGMELGHGSGLSKKEAQTAAAQNALDSPLLPEIMASKVLS